MPNLGDRVLAWWPAEDDWFYPGVVCDINGSEFDVQFDDGGRAKVPIAEVRPLNVTIGNRVFGNWKGGGQYYPGRVASTFGHTLHIDYDDGDKESTSVSMVRVHREDLDSL